MRVYYSGPSPDNLRKARKHAPSHTHGACWTPAKMTVSGLSSEVPYFIDNGAFSDKFEGEAWVNTVEKALLELDRDPDFVVMPDVPGDAEATIELHRKWLYENPLPLRAGELQRYWVIQPGLPIAEQFEAIEGCQGVFIGGSKRWLRAHGDEIVREARERDLQTHVGNPSGAEGLEWAYRTGFDSADTTSVFQNQYWNYLKRLERATDETGTSDPDDGTQLDLTDSRLVTDGGTDVTSPDHEAEARAYLQEARSANSPTVRNDLLEAGLNHAGRIDDRALAKKLSDQLANEMCPVQAVDVSGGGHHAN